MDLSAAARDIYELVEAFAEMEAMRLDQLKDLWRSCSFSFIHEARPKDTTQAFFMQSLYSSALSHVKSDKSLSWKIGGLYVLYCLYETQFVEPHYLIYLSLVYFDKEGMADVRAEDLEKLHILVKELRGIEHTEALKVVRTMIQKEAFLFGCVSVDQKSISDACEKLASQAAARLKFARFRLLGNVPLKGHIYGNLAQDLCLDVVTSVIHDYTAAKHHVFTGLGSLEVNRDAPGLSNIEAFDRELNQVADDWECEKEEILTKAGLSKSAFQEGMPPTQKKQKQRAPVVEKPQDQQHRTEDDDLADEILGLIEMR